MLKPDFYESSFITVNNKSELPITVHKNIEFVDNEPSYWIWARPIIAIVGVIIFFKKIKVNHNLLKLDLLVIHFQD